MTQLIEINYDRENKIEANSNIKDGTVLYRLTSINFTDKEDILSGGGSVTNTNSGRFHVPNQRTTYCSDNILLCISEILFHNYRTVLDLIHENRKPEQIRDKIISKKCLVIIDVSEVKELVFIDSENFPLEYNQVRMRGAKIVHPDVIYNPFHDVSNLLRENNKNGIIYPSARHSKDVAIAFFRDETEKIRDNVFYKLPIKIVLVPENIDPEDCEYRTCNPFTEKIHSTMGYYRIKNINLFENLKQKGLINPSNMKSKGMIDFVRRRYLKYPEDAILSKKRGI